MDPYYPGAMRWDIFCKVIDNHGDIGVCWRLGADLAARGESVRLWVDDAAALAWMAPGGHAGVEVHGWADAAGAEPGDVVVEAFGCELDEAVQSSIASASRVRGAQPAWINLEYLSAEPWVERCHGLQSPVMAGPAKGLVKRFFYPGFTRATGGLLREPKVLQRRAHFDRAAWLHARGIAWRGQQLVSLFCYEPPGLEDWLRARVAAGAPLRLLVTAGRAERAVRSLPADLLAAIDTEWLPLMPQTEYDHLLWSCDFNFVRGEDSLVRALWAGAPFAWHIYPQDDGAHETKLAAFLDWIGAPPSLRALHAAWNSGHGDAAAWDLPAWQGTLQCARADLLAQDDLATQLLAFVRG